MGFIESIFSGLSSVFSDLFGLSGILGSVASGSGLLTALSALSTIITNLVGTINGLIGGLVNSIGSFIKPITDVVGGVSTLVNTIQDKIIAPILTPIVQTITTFERLDVTISRLVDDGIKGLLQIPAAIADALTGVNAAFERSMRQLGISNDANIKNTFLPGMEAILGPGLGGVSAAFLKFSEPKGLAATNLAALDLAGSGRDVNIKEFIQRYMQRWQKPDSWIDQLAAMLLDLAGATAILTSATTNVAKQAQQAANSGNPVDLLDPATVVVAHQRGIINDAGLSSELAKNGLDGIRQAILKELAEYLPGPQEAFRWYTRGSLHAATYADVLKKHGMSEDQALAFSDDQRPLIPPASLVDWLQRRFITQVQFNDLMAAHGYTAETIEIVAKAGKQPRDVAVTILSHFNTQAANKGWFPESYDSSPPPDVVQVGLDDGLETDEVKRVWTSRLAAMPISTAVNLFFRGEINRTEVRIVVEQNGYPPAMTDLFIASLNTLLPYRSIPNLVEDGSLSPADARIKLKQRGFREEDVELLIGAAEKALEKSGSAPETDATKLSVAAIGDAYETGLIDDATYRSLLQQRGLSGADADITIALKQYALMVQEKKNEVDTLKAEIQLGTMTVDQAVNRLLERGFTGPEVSRIQVQLLQTRRANAKLPEFATIKRMVKASLLTVDDFLQYLLATGYDEEWANLIVQLETAPGPSDG